jgi:2-oxoglutarate ferredoxin oxidoreductase subunit beta
MHPLAEKYLRKSSLPTLFCPGCGHGTVLNCFIRAIDELGIIDGLGLVSGIGCSSWVPVFVNTDVLHTLHGRAIAVATGLKLANPELQVVVFTGDGDCLGIGGNHFIHAARRNIDMTVIMLDNYIYGMTGGQMAPTTPTDSCTQTSPYGNPEPPIDACKLAIASGATYVARWTTAQPAALVKAMKAAIRHKGFSFIDAISQCPTQAGRYIFADDDPVALLEMLKTRKISRAQAAKLSEQELQGRIVTGELFEDNQKQEFTARIYSLMETAKG